MTPNRKRPANNQRKHPRLTSTRVIEGAVALADQIGVDALTIRRLAEAINTRPMTIYNHVPSKEAIIDGMVDHIYSKVSLPPQNLAWKPAIQVRCRSLRDVLNRHWWATPLLDSHRQTDTPMPAMLQHFDSVLGTFLNAGFSHELTGHAYATIDSFVYGFTLQETALPNSDEVSEMATSITDQIPTEQLPHLIDFTANRVMQPDYHFGDSFEVGLDLILTGLQNAKDRTQH